MYRNYRLILCAIPFILFGCASPQKIETAKLPAGAEAAVAPEVTQPVKPAKPKPATATKTVVRAVKSADGLIDGEIVGTPLPGSKFAQLQIGMKLTQVQNLIGRPDTLDSRITSKQFQPFYVGGDTQRAEAFYKNEGQLTFSNMHPEGSADTLIRIVVNPDIAAKR